MVLKSHRKEQKFLMRKMKVFTTLATLLSIVTIFACLGFAGYYGYDIYKTFFGPNPPNFNFTETTTVNEVKASANTLFDACETVLKIPNILIGGFVMIGVTFIIRAVANFLLLTRASYDARTIIKSNKVKRVRIVKYIFSILFAGAACVAFMYVPKHFITEPLLNAVQEQLHNAIDAARNIININTNTNQIPPENVEALQNAFNQLQDIQNLPIIQDMQTWAYWKQTIPYFVISSIGIVGLFINQLILGSISLAMIRHFKPENQNVKATNNAEKTNVAPQTDTNNNAEPTTSTTEDKA